MLVVRLTLIFFIFLFSINIALASDISQFVFSTNPQTIKPNEISETLTIQVQDAEGNSVKLLQTACLHLETTSGTGQFSSNSTNWESVSQLTMNKNTANRNFYYKDSTPGNYTLTVKAALTSCSAWTAEEWIVNQDIIVSADAEPKPLEPTPGVGSVDWPTEPQIYANAGPDKTAVAGTDVKFSGQALGLQKEPLDNARYLWSFGDGAIAEGQNVLHTYQYPGEYIVVLNVSSGKYSASDRLVVKVVTNQLEIIEVSKNYIKLHNGSKNDLDISNWFLRSNNPSEADKLFKFPETTIIKASSDLNVSSSISGIEVNNQNQKTELLYPNGLISHSFIEPLMSNNLEKTKTSELPSQKENINIESKPSPEISSDTDTETETDTETMSSNTEQIANVISATQDKKLTTSHWVMIILGIGLVSGIGFVLIRRKGFL